MPNFEQSHDKSYADNIHRMPVFGAVLEDNYDGIDADRDGSLSRRELDGFAANTENAAGAREVASMVSKHFDEFKGLTSRNDRAGLFDPAPGPFYSKDSPENVSRDDVRALSRIMARPENFEKEVRNMRAGEIEFGVIFGGMFGAFTGYMAACIPVVPVVCGTFAALGGLSTAAVVGPTVKGRTDFLRQQYSQRKKMLDSWQFFE